MIDMKTEDIKTKEFIYPPPSTTTKFTKDAKCLSDIIDNFVKEKGKTIKVRDIKYGFFVITRMVGNVIDPKSIQPKDIAVSSALIIYEKVEK